MSTSDRRQFIKRTASGVAAMALPAMAGVEIRPERLVPLRLRDPVTVGLIGAGRQGRAILGELAKFENVTVKGVCDVVEGRLRSGLRRARGAEGYADHRELLDKAGVDAVVVATPTHKHRQVALDALGAGKHVYCESPLASTVEDCKAIADAARGSVFHVGMQGRSDPIYTLARSFVRTDAVRDLVALRAQYRRKTSWRTPSPDPAREKELNWRLDPEVSIGLAGELGTQQFDAIHWFISKYPASVRGSGSIRAYDDGRTIPDSINCELTFANGLVLAYEATIGNSYGKTYELYSGTNATVKTAWTHGWMFKEADAPTQGWEVYANRQQFGNEEGITLIADATKLASQGKLQKGVGLENPPLYYAIEDFLRSVGEGVPVACSASEGMRAAIVGIMANKAVMTGETIDLGDVLKA